MGEKTARYAISVQEAANRLGISRAQAYSAAQQGLLPTIRLGKRCVRVPIASLERLLGGELVDDQ